MKWAVRLIVDKYDIKELKKMMKPPKTDINKVDNNYFFISNEFNKMNNSEEILKTAEEHIIYIKSLFKIYNDKNLEISVDMVVNLENPKNKVYYLFVKDYGTVTDKVKIGSINKHEKLIRQDNIQDDEIKEAFQLTFEDEEIQKILKLVDHQGLDDWSNLYKIFEIIESNVEPIKLGCITKKEINRFKHTANHPKAIGNDARHGYMKSKPPENPMKLEEAKRLIKDLIKRWIKINK